ncbi:hypothetical protein AG1IA_06455 [Rhizoctonia solani AG-1 IA]|uniref:Uncharacterized protein n=1 Tax=Thanatephorus cucumeris (strain AG1-IA) TaxID=983506 RepID=L8WNF0_THACA|nr:hypothetical protein AG1IA_06455 [Rhizoctonia solani AG-1 IA]
MAPLNNPKSKKRAPLISLTGEALARQVICAICEESDFVLSKLHYDNILPLSGLEFLLPFCPVMLSLYWLLCAMGLVRPVEVTKRTAVGTGFSAVNLVCINEGIFEGAADGVQATSDGLYTRPRWA